MQTEQWIKICRMSLKHFLGWKFIALNSCVRKEKGLRTPG